MTEATHQAAVTERAARAGGVVAKQAFRSKLQVEQKSTAIDVVTSADRDAQQQVLATIAEEFPDARIVCEEDVQSAGVTDIDVLDSVPESGDAWVVDPIDGTANYSRGLHFWGTSVAAVNGAEPVGVATYLPTVGDIYTAGPESVLRNEESMTVSDRTDPETFTVGVIGRWSADSPAKHATLVRETIERFGDARHLGSMQGTLALVAAGSLDAAIRPNPSQPWDSLAGAHLIRRAGGRVTTVDGERWTNGAGPIVASNDTCHDRVCAAARACLDTADA